MLSVGMWIFVNLCSMSCSSDTREVPQLRNPPLKEPKRPPLVFFVGPPYTRNVQNKEEGTRQRCSLSVEISRSLVGDFNNWDEAVSAGQLQ